MNTAAVTWFILQATHSEMSLSALVVIQTVPALLMLPFTGVIIDREDRRRLIMLLDALRGALILGVAFLAFRNRVQVWHLYAMGALVAAGFWMFWPTITALIQELSPESEFVGAESAVPQTNFAHELRLLPDRHALPAIIGYIRGRNGPVLSGLAGP